MSNIEWTERTWNPVVGCTPVSPGCLNCYAATMARRLEAMGVEEYRPRIVDPKDGLDVTTIKSIHDNTMRTVRIAEVRGGRAVFTGDVRTVPDRLEVPLKRRTPTVWFVNSMSDLFHGAVPFEFIDRVFAVMALCPQHTFQVLTKRPERMVEYMASRTPTKPGHVLPPEWLHWMNDVKDADDKNLSTKYRRPKRYEFVRNKWPASNIWLGTSVEDQQRADERIPHLLRCPAAVRFLSCEPLLGPLDLSGWAENTAKVTEAAATWADHVWPAWVPADQRKHIEDFWSSSYGRNPQQWVRDNVSQRTPATGSTVGVKGLGPSGREIGWVCKVDDPEATARGRWLHCWNNMGRVITDDGRTLVCSAPGGPGWLDRWLQSDGKYRHRIHWVIVGGESGPGARPCNVEWIRAIVRQCKAAAVPCFVKQLGAAPMLEDHGYCRDCRVWDRADNWDLCKVSDCNHATADGVLEHSCGSVHHNIYTGEPQRLNDRKGGDPSEWPEDLRVREMPHPPAAEGGSR